MLRKLLDRALLFLLAVLGGWCDSRGSSRQESATSEGHNVILVVSDGLRWQEVFRGADSLLMFGSPQTLGGNGAVARRRYWRATTAERRAALLPFVWGTMATQGSLLGNRDLGSSMNVTNGMNFSYPGYNEMLVGYPDPRINTNDVGPNPNVTVFEWINGRAGYKGHVAAVGAWDTFGDIFNRGRSGLRIHASRAEPLDARAHAAAMRALEEFRPRALFVAYVETDDYAHQGRYDLTLNAAHAVDRNLAALWAAAQSNARYRGKTTLIFTADHGRGATAEDWRSHGKDIGGSEQTWLAVIGPNTPARGATRNMRRWR